jgi:hypothetical protein
LVVTALLTFASQLQLARATTQLFFVSGSIVSSGDPSLAGDLPAGAQIFGSFSLDDSVPNTSGISAEGIYNGAFLQSSFNFGLSAPYTVNTTGGDLVLEYHNPQDVVSIFAGSYYSAPAALTPSDSTAPWQLVGWNLQLVSQSADALTSNAFPTPEQLVDLTPYDFEKDLTLVFYNTQTPQYAFATALITSISTVPEPSPWALSLTAICALAICKKHAKRLGPESRIPGHPSRGRLATTFREAFVRDAGT